MNCLNSLNGEMKGEHKGLSLPLTKYVYGMDKTMDLCRVLAVKSMRKAEKVRKNLDS